MCFEFSEAADKVILYYEVGRKRKLKQKAQNELGQPLYEERKSIPRYLTVYGACNRELEMDCAKSEEMEDSDDEKETRRQKLIGLVFAFNGFVKDNFTEFSKDNLIDVRSLHAPGSHSSQ